MSFPVVSGNPAVGLDVINGETLTTVTPVAGETFYYRFYINDLGVGEYNSSGVYLGVPITLPVNFTTGSSVDHSSANNALLSKLIRDQVISYIQQDSSIYSVTYIRSFSTVVDDELGHSIELAPRISGQPLIISFSSSIPSENALFYNPTGPDVLEELTPTNSTVVADYIQTVQTAFRSEYDQGYLAAPAAFAQFEKIDREALGIAMENLCSDPDYSWLAVIDPGNSDINEVEFSVQTVDFSPSIPQPLGTYIRSQNSIYQLLDDYDVVPSYVNDGGNVRRVEIVSKGSTLAPNGVYSQVPIVGVTSGTGSKATVKIVGGKPVRVDIGGQIKITASITSSDFVAGENYVNGSYSNVPLIGGSGIGLLADLTVAGGVVTAVSIVVSQFINQSPANSGAGYRVGDVLTVDNTNLGGVGSGFSLTLKAADFAAAPAGINYIDADTATLGNLTGGYAISTELRVYTNSILRDADTTANGGYGNSSQFIPANPGNPFLTNGLEINNRRYSLPLRVDVPIGTFGATPANTVSIPTTNPLTQNGRAELEAALSELLRAYPTISLRDERSILEDLIRQNKAVLYDSGVDTPSKLREDGLQYQSPFGYVAYYGPYLIDTEQYKVPPSCFVIGIALRRTQAEGFQEPPAGAKFPVQGALRPEFEITRQHQLSLNPLGINAIRDLPDKGVVVWGARTRSDNPLFKFVNTRVVLNVIIGTARNAFDTLIFNSIDGRGLLFGRIRETLEEFLFRLWRGNALFGENPKDAFRVFCDRRNNSAIDLENGRVRANIYVAVVPTLELIEIDIVRVAIDQVQNVVESEGFS
jgi:hypothetical protein